VKIQKVSVVPFLWGILAGLAAGVITAVCGNAAKLENRIAAGVSIGVIVMIIGMFLAPTVLFYISKKKAPARLQKMGFTLSHTFHGSSNVLFLDQSPGMLAVRFRMIPSLPQTISAKDVEKAWTDDGMRGSGKLAGTYGVSFLFTVGTTTLRFYTFQSTGNRARRFAPNSREVLEGVSKADLMVQAIMQAKQTAAGVR